MTNYYNDAFKKLSFLIHRYELDSELLKSHPGNELLEKRIARHKKEIVDLVLSDAFKTEMRRIIGG